MKLGNAGIALCVPVVILLPTAKAQSCTHFGTAFDGALVCSEGQNCTFDNAASVSLITTSGLDVRFTGDNNVVVTGPGYALWSGIPVTYNCCPGGCTVFADSAPTTLVPSPPTTQPIGVPTPNTPTPVATLSPTPTGLFPTITPTLRSPSVTPFPTGPTDPFATAAPSSSSFPTAAPTVHVWTDSWKSKVLAIAPKIPAFLSVLSSMYIVQNVLSRRDKRKNLYHRLMCGMSMSDILSSHIYFLGTWLIPRGTVGGFGPVYGASGTRATCGYAGFFNQFAVASPIYNSTLCAYYLLKIRMNWTDVGLERLEPFLHGIPWVFAFITSVTAASLQLYGPVEWTCWINPSPPKPQYDIPAFQWAFLFGPVWISVAFCTVVMLMLWWTMRQQERMIAEKYQLRASTAKAGGGAMSAAVINQSSNKQSQRIATQGMLYVGAFYVTWLFPTINRIVELIAPGTQIFALQAFDTSLLPLQGLLNVLIYLRYVLF
jgi:hypothetical protein